MEKLRHREYLEKHLEEPVLQPSCDRLLGTPVRQCVEHYKQQGELSVAVDQAVIRYAWQPAGNLPEKGSAYGGYKDIIHEPEEWRELIGAEIAGRGGAPTLDMLRTLVPGCRVFFHARPGQARDVGYHVSDDVIRIETRLDRPETALLLLQQVHQAWDISAHDEYTWNQSRLKNFFFSKEQRRNAELLRSARTAWAMTMRSMRPFVSGAPNATYNAERLWTYIHNEPLAELAETIRHPHQDER